MAAPSKSWTPIPDSKIDADSPVIEELKTFERDNAIHTDERVGIPVAPGNRTANHRHRGLGVDGSDFIELTPQENLISDGDNPDTSFTATPGGGGESLSFETANLYKIIRGKTGFVRPVALSRPFISANLIKKIKSAAGKGRFTCSMHMKRVAAAAGVVGGTMRFGLYSGGFLTGAFVDIDFDDVTQEYKRFYFVSNQITRPASLAIRAQWVGNPSDWDTVGEEDEVGHNGGYMVTNGQGIAKWDISHRDGTADDYDADANNLFYWWDEVITVVQETV